MAITPSFTVSLGQVVLPGLVIVGKFDGVTPSLACATTGGRVFLHQAVHGSGGGAGAGAGWAPSAQLRFLNINRDVTALGVARGVIPPPATGGSGSASVSGSSSGAGGGTAGSAGLGGEGFFDFDLALPSAPPTGPGADIGLGSGAPGGGSAAGGGLARDALLIGTAASLQAYDPEANRDLFHKEAQDGATCIVAGSWPYAVTAAGAAAAATTSGGSPAPIAFTGGSGSIAGCNAEGTDVFWSVTGDAVTALALGDVDGDGQPELLTGSAGSDIRAFKGAAVDAGGGGRGGAGAKARAGGAALAGGAPGSGDAPAPAGEGAVVFEASETDAVTAVSVVAPGLIVYGLSNGTLGAYGTQAAAGAAGGTNAAAGGGGAPGAAAGGVTAGSGGLARLWRVRAKGAVTAVAAFDLDGDGVPEVASGWASGKLEIRRAGSGELLFRDQLPGAIAGLAVADYRGDGRPLLLVVTGSGELRGYPSVDVLTLLAYRRAEGILPTPATHADAPGLAPLQAFGAGSAAGAPTSPSLTGAAASMAPLQALAAAAAGAMGMPAGAPTSTRGGDKAGGPESPRPVAAVGSMAGPAPALPVAAATAILGAVGIGSGKPAKPAPSVDPAAAALAAAQAALQEAAAIQSLLEQRAALEAQLQELDAATAAATALAADGSGSGGGSSTSETTAGRMDTPDDAVPAPAGAASASLLRALAGAEGRGAGAAPSDPNAVPVSADIELRLEPNAAARRVDLVAHARHPGTVLRCVTAFVLDGPFFGPGRESAAALAPSEPSAALGAPSIPKDVRALRVPLAPATNCAATLQVVAAVGPRAGAPAFAALERSLPWPKYGMFQHLPLLPPGVAPGIIGSPLGRGTDAASLPPSPPLPTSSVTFALPERAGRLAMWLASAFLVGEGAIVALATPASPPAASRGGAAGGSAADAPAALLTGVALPSQPLSLDARFACVRSGGSRMLRIAVAFEWGGPAVVQCDDMALAGEVIADMCAFLGVAQLDTRADFPAQLEAFKGTLMRLQELQGVRARLTGDMAGAAQQAKALVVAAEDARLRSDMPGMGRHYGELRGAVGDLTREYTKRAAAHGALLDCLRDTNSMIQRAAGLRVGDARARVVAACRAAIASGNPLSMLTTIATGQPPM